MCLSAEAFAVFLNLLGASVVTTDIHQVTVHATRGDVTWHASVDDWCTAAPYTAETLPFLTATTKVPFTAR